MSKDGCKLDNKAQWESSFYSRLINLCTGALRTFTLRIERKVERIESGPL